MAEDAGLSKFVEILAMQETRLGKCEH